MSTRPMTPLGSLRNVEEFRRYLQTINLDIPCDEQLEAGRESVLASPLEVDGKRIGNRFCIHPMEGWDGTPEGRPSEHTMRRWRLFGRSGAKLIWGGEAVAVCHEGRANPNQLLINEDTLPSLARLREALLEEHLAACGTIDDLLVGLQLTDSGRYSQPNEKGRPEPRILYRHPILDRRHKLGSDYPLLTDKEIRSIISDFHRAAQMAAETGFDFVDIKHCHGYLGHEFLSAHTRAGDFGGSFENRTRFLKEIVEGVRKLAPALQVGVRLSAFDLIPFRPDQNRAAPGKTGPGIPEPFDDLLPYRWGFGINVQNPVEIDLAETFRFVNLLRELKIKLLNITAGSPYYNPHIQRPALYPPSDGYQPPEDPLVGVSRQMNAARQIKEAFPEMLTVGTAYTYLQDFLPYAAQAAVRAGWIDSVGLGRMVLAYPELPRDVIGGKTIAHKRICRTFSDCTTAPRNGLPSGCYPLDDYYKNSETGAILKKIKAASRGSK